MEDHISGTADVYYPVYDANGNVAAMIDSAGANDAWYLREPFGKYWFGGGAYREENPFQFSTKYFDRETGLYYYGYRMYDPVTGRWASRDPIEEEGGLNIYGFLENDAFSNQDYLGLAPCFPRVDGEAVRFLPAAVDTDFEEKMEDLANDLALFIFAAELVQAGGATYVKGGFEVLVDEGSMLWKKAISSAGIAKPAVLTKKKLMQAIARFAVNAREITRGVDAYYVLSFHCVCVCEEDKHFVKNMFIPVQNKLTFDGRWGQDEVMEKDFEKELNEVKELYKKTMKAICDRYN